MRRHFISPSFPPPQPLPVPDSSSPSCMVKMAAAGVWVVYSNKVTYMLEYTGEI